jgi:hypothetical protein
MFWGFDHGRPLVDRAWVVHRDDKEWCLRVGRGGLDRGRSIVRSNQLFSLDERVSESTDGKGQRTYLSGRSIYGFSVVDRNDGNRRDRGNRGGNLAVDKRREVLLVDNGGFVLGRFFLGFRGSLDATLFSRSRDGGGDLFLLVYGNESRDGCDLGFLCSRWFVTGRIVLRFRRGMIDIIHVSSPVGLGRGLVDGGPPAVDDVFVHDPLLPGNADGGYEAGRTLVQTNGTSPLLEKEM